MWPPISKKCLLTLGGISAVAAGIIAGVTVLPDHVKVVDSAGALSTAGDETVFVTGSHWGGCFCMFRYGADVKVGNVTGGPSQVAALSSTHSLSFNSDVSVWNGVGGDVYNTNPPVGPPVAMKIKVWKVWGGSAADNDIAVAKDALTKYKTGISLVSLGVSAATAPSSMNLSCEDIPTLKAGPNYEDTAVNVYYAEGASCTGRECEGLNGASCDNRKFIFVYSTGPSNVMLHELGHSLLGPDHWRSSTVGLTNIMNDATATSRSSIATGQAIFMNYDQNSVFNKLRNNPGIDCSAKCPRVDLDESWSDYCMPPPQATPPPPPPPPVEQWFGCIECREGQFERMLTTPDANIVPALNAPFTDQGRGAKAVSDADEAHRDNVLAGRQRRAAIALAVLAKQGNLEARRALTAAYDRRTTFREDVTHQLVRSYQMIQQQ